jgi:TIR domain
MIAEAAEWDVFISHASEDKDDFVRRLAHGLEEKGLKVWFDEFTLTVGDSLRRSIKSPADVPPKACPKLQPDFSRH